MLDMACILQSLDLEFNFVHCRYSGRITGWWWSPTSSVQLVRGCATSATPVHPPVMDQLCIVHCTTQCSSPSDMHWSQIQFYPLYSAVLVYWTCYINVGSTAFWCNDAMHSCAYRNKLNSKCDYMQMSTIVNFVTSAIIVNLCFAVLQSCSNKYICATSWYCNHNQMQFFKEIFSLLFIINFNLKANLVKSKSTKGFNL